MYNTVILFPFDDDPERRPSVGRNNPLLDVQFGHKGNILALLSVVVEFVAVISTAVMIVHTALVGIAAEIGPVVPVATTASRNLTTIAGLVVAV